MKPPEPNPTFFQQVEVTLKLRLVVPARLALSDVEQQVAVNIASALPAWTAHVSGPPVEILLIHESRDRVQTH